MLRPQVLHHVFVSTVSVYASFAAANDEDSPVGELEDATVKNVDGRTSGPLTALCESAATAVVYGADRTTVIRPGQIVGPGRQYRSLHLLAGACGPRRPNGHAELAARPSIGE